MNLADGIIIGDPVGQLLCDTEGGEGDITLSPNFYFLEGYTLQIDVINDWIGLLEKAKKRIIEAEKEADLEEGYNNG